jgi:hypothetical protein
MGTDTAAILSQIDVPPSRWRHVDMAFLPDGRVLVTVTPKGRGYPRVVVLPDRSAAAELGLLLNQHARLAMTRPGSAERRRLEAAWRRRDGRAWEIKVTTTGSPDRVRGKLAA